MNRFAQILRSGETITTEEDARIVQYPWSGRYGREIPHNTKYCCASVPDGGRSMGFHQCGNAPKHFYGSLGYCTKHDPNYIIQKKLAWEADYEAKLAAERAKRNLQALKAEFTQQCIEAVRTIAAGHNDARGLCQNLLYMFKDVAE